MMIAFADSVAQLLTTVLARMDQLGYPPAGSGPRPRPEETSAGSCWDAQEPQSQQVA